MAHLLDESTSPRSSARLSRRHMIAGLALLVSAGLLAACSGGQNTPPTTAPSAPAQPTGAPTSASSAPTTSAAPSTVKPVTTPATGTGQSAATPAGKAVSASPASITFWHVDSGSLNKPVADAITDFEQQH